MPSNKSDMLGVIFDSDKDLGPSIDSDKSMFYIPFYKDEEYFSVYENEVMFIKGVEALVRKHRFYSAYIKYLIDVVGINRCQVLSNIEIEDNITSKVTIEMHHGPILTLYDIVSIVLNHLRNQGDTEITTPKVADIVLEEHRQNHVHVVLLSKSVHQQVHEGNVSLNYNQGFGDTAAFLEKYGDGATKEMRAKINKFIEWSDSNDSYDNEVFKVPNKLKVWGNNDFPI